MFGRVFTCIVLILADARHTIGSEPLCLSRYDYDYKILQKLVTLEQEQANVKLLLDKQSETIRHQENKIERLRTEYEGSLKTLDRRLRDITMVTGAVYIRWGRTECPGNGTEMVYSGYAGGSYYTHEGAAADYLCLPKDPIWAKYDDTNQGHGYVYGAQYELPGGRDKTLFNTALHDNDVPCAVCRSSRSSTVMVPARNECYGGWTREYSGYLMTGYYGHSAASEYACLDGNPDVIAGGQSEEHGKLFYATEARCGPLKCPPYVHDRELTCVVCTK